MTTLEPLPPIEGREPVEASAAPRIMVVDDEVTIRYVLARHLSRAGYRVDSAVDADAAWDSLCRRAYDLLITDYSLPGPNGFELVARVRGAQRDLPVFLISGVIDPAAVEAHRGLNFTAVFRKPFNLDDILDHVSRTVGVPRRPTTAAHLARAEGEADPYRHLGAWSSGGLND